MKTAFDPRHQNREEIVKSLFTWEFRGEKTDNEQANLVVSHLPQIDELVKSSASQWPLEQINKIDLAIRRLALYELTVGKAEPIKVIIDEAVELAKEFGGESSPAFVNGVLGAILKKQEPENES